MTGIRYFSGHRRVQYAAVGKTRGQFDARRDSRLVRFQFVTRRSDLAQRVYDNRVRYRQHARVRIWQRNLRILYGFGHRGTVRNVRH